MNLKILILVLILLGCESEEIAKPISCPIVLEPNSFKGSVYKVLVKGEGIYKLQAKTKDGTILYEDAQENLVEIIVLVDRETCVEGKVLFGSKPKTFIIQYLGESNN